MVLGCKQLASIYHRMKLDRNLFSSVASQLGLSWVGSLTHPSAPYHILAPFLLVTPRCPYTSPGGEFWQPHVVSCSLKILWMFMGWETTEKLQTNLQKASLVTGRLRYRLAWKHYSLLKTLPRDLPDIFTPSQVITKNPWGEEFRSHILKITRQMQNIVGRA